MDDSPKVFTLPVLKAIQVEGRLVVQGQWGAGCKPAAHQHRRQVEGWHHRRRIDRVNVLVAKKTVIPSAKQPERTAGLGRQLPMSTAGPGVCVCAWALRLPQGQILVLMLCGVVEIPSPKNAKEHDKKIEKK
jgi:hypothetical protein